jgi:hypothetical protein
MKYTRLQWKRILGYGAGIIVLMFLGEDAMDSLGKMFQLYMMRDSIAM